PVRRWTMGVSHEFDRRLVARAIPRTWDLCYATPGYLPRQARGYRVLYAANRHPRVERRLTHEARRSAGGGRPDMTLLDQRRWEGALVQHVDAVLSPDVPALLRASHALILPSVSDGFAYVVLEAMAAGCVPFVTPTAGASEIARLVDERLVQPRDEFASVVARL